MPLTRWIVSVRTTQATPIRDAIVNTLYFNVSGSVDDPDYNSLGNDLWTIWAGRPWSTGRFMDIRGYDMGDATPRPQKFLRTGLVAGSLPSSGPPQVGLCLSYYADRNLVSQRGRIYIGPWVGNDPSATITQVTAVMALPPLLAGLGGLNVDWSIYSPKLGIARRINHAWADDSWDIIRARKIPPIRARVLWDGNG